MARVLSRRWWLVLGALLIPGPISLAVFLYIRMRPKNQIERVLVAHGIGKETARMWVAVSAFETASWTSEVYRKAHNLFGLIIPGSKRLDFGEGQTIFANNRESIEALYKSVIVARKYAANYTTIDFLVADMKAKGYFTGNVTNYVAGVKAKYKALYQ